MKVKWVLITLTLGALTHNTNGLLGKLMKKMKKNSMKAVDNCNCACREYWTTKCTIEYRTECKQLYTHRECKKIPEERPMRVKEVECQKCIRYYETIFKTSTEKQCVDVYDEKCETKYPAKCTEDQSCTMVYQTKCDTVGYSQKCQQVPVSKCQAVTKCHRIPKTTCRPFKKEKCGKTKVQKPVKKLMHKCMPYENPVPEDLSSCGGGVIDAGNNGAPSSSYGVPSASPSSSYGTPVGTPIGAPSGAPVRAPSSGYSTSSGGQNIAPPPPAPVPHMKAPRGPISHSSFNNVIQEDSYGKPVTAPLNGNSQGSFISNNNVGNSQGSFISNNNVGEDSYGTPFGSPINNNAIQNNQNNANPFLTNSKNEDSYGTPFGSPINNNAIQNNQPIPTKYVSPLVNNNNNDIAFSAPSSYNNNQNNNAWQAPSKYSGPIGEYTPILTPSQNTRSEIPGSVQATIRVVNPPGNVGNGPFIPSDNSYGPLVTQESQRNGLPGSKSDNVHPNQLSRDFKPSVRLPDSFVHQIGNMVIKPEIAEVFKPAASNEQKNPIGMKKMVFPESSEEFNDITIGILPDDMSTFRPMNPVNPTNPTKPTNKPLPVPQGLLPPNGGVDNSKPVEATEISGGEEYYDEFDSSLSGEYDYDYYGNSEEFRTLTEDAIQTLLLSNNKDIAAINEELTLDGLTPTAIGQMSQDELVKEREKLIKDILRDEESENPFLKRLRKRRRRIRPYGQVQRRPRQYFRNFGRKIKPSSG